MSTRLDRLPLSRVNRVLGAVLLAGFATTIALGLAHQAFLLGLYLVVFVIGVYRGRRVLASTADRVGAFEYLDERDRTIARDGFAAVGAVAMALSVVEFVVTSVVAPDWDWIPAAQSVLLGIVWGAAVRAADRRR